MDFIRIINNVQNSKCTDLILHTCFFHDHNVTHTDDRVQ